jgi:hypothetical protein
VRYLVVGGYAMAAHGYPRYTDDIDFWVEPEQKNAEKLISILNEFGFGSLKITVDDFLSPDRILQLGYPPYRIDIMTSVESLDFASSWENKITVEVDSMPMHFISLEHLRKNKKSVGRTQDLADLENLPEE